MENTLLSIIVPVYNVELYIRKCLDSILNQTFREYELILVDDGSTDQSGAICDEYALKDNRIVVIHKENEGQSTARNCDIKASSGKYITFIDSDDEYGTKSTIEENIKFMLADDTVDILQYPTLWSGEGRESLLSQKKQIYICDGESFRGVFRNIITTTAWDKIYKRNLLDKVQFPVGRIFEDTFFIMDILKYAHNVIITNCGYYKYKIRSGSTMKSSFSPQKYVDYFDVIFKMLNKAREFKEGEDFYMRTTIQLINRYMLARKQHGKDVFCVYEKQINAYIPRIVSIMKCGFQYRLMDVIKLLVIKSIGLNSYCKLYEVIKW